jgi:hypothetical protein
MNSKFHFTYANIEQQYQAALDQGYTFCTCEEYVALKQSGLPQKLIVNRIDIDFSAKKAERLGEIYNRLGIKGSFFVRLHAPEYNPFDFENYRVIKGLIDAGHEIGYHSEIVDVATIWDESVEQCLIRDINVLNQMFNIKIIGVASHGGLTGLNNLDFWHDKIASDYGLLYEGYDKQDSFNLFDTSFYVSDSEWTQWKCYDQGTLMAGDRRSFEEHLADKHSLIYLLIHSDTYFDKHFYE